MRGRMFFRMILKMSRRAPLRVHVYWKWINQNEWLGFGDDQEKKAKHREEKERAMLEHIQTMKEKKELRKQHLEFLRLKEECELARQAQEEHIRQQEEHI